MMSVCDSKSESFLQEYLQNVYPGCRPAQQAPLSEASSGDVDIRGVRAGDEDAQVRAGDHRRVQGQEPILRSRVTTPAL
jgi:hypothetical protein